MVYTNKRWGFIVWNWFGDFRIISYKKYVSVPFTGQDIGEGVAYSMGVNRVKEMDKKGILEYVYLRCI